MLFVPLTNNSVIKHQEVLINVTPIRNHSESKKLLYLAVNSSTETSAI